MMYVIARCCLVLALVASTPPVAVEDDPVRPFLTDVVSDEDRRSDVDLAKAFLREPAVRESKEGGKLAGHLIQVYPGLAETRDLSEPSNDAAQSLRQRAAKTGRLVVQRLYRLAKHDINGEVSWAAASAIEGIATHFESPIVKLYATTQLADLCAQGHPYASPSTIKALWQRLTLELSDDRADRSPYLRLERRGALVTLLVVDLNLVEQVIKVSSLAKDAPETANVENTGTQILDDLRRCLRANDPESQYALTENLIERTLKVKNIAPQRIYPEIRQEIERCVVLRREAVSLVENLAKGNEEAARRAIDVLRVHPHDDRSATAILLPEIRASPVSLAWMVPQGGDSDNCICAVVVAIERVPDEGRGERRVSVLWNLRKIESGGFVVSKLP